MATTKEDFRIHPATRPGHLHLNVADLDQQLEFYQQVIGLTLHWQEDRSAGLGAGASDLVRLTQIPDGRRHPGTTGLYHFALLLPDRRELARAIGRLFALRYTNYPTDHAITKSTYLDDPEGQNIELYADSPEDASMELIGGERFVRMADGSMRGGRDPLDLEALFRNLGPDDQLDQPMPPDTTIGHVHLYVADLRASMDFYHGVLGLDDMGIGRGSRMGMASAGRYHHHIGFNTWMGEGAPPPPPDSLGLRYLTLVLPTPRELDRVLKQVRAAGPWPELIDEGWVVRDPSQNAIVLTSQK